MTEPLQINKIEIKQANCLDQAFFDQPCIDLANALLGKYLVRRLSCGTLLIGKIVETESYLGVEDRASHSYNNRRTPRNEPMYMKPGTIYVYFTYGMYHCFNLSSQESGGAVLIRSLEPVHGLDIMNRLRNQFNENQNKSKRNNHLPNSQNNEETHSQSNRNSPAKKQKLIKSKQTLSSNDWDQPNKKSKLQDRDLCNGPSKLCISMDITIEYLNKRHICESEEMWVQDLDCESNITIVESSRIGIGDFAKEWKAKLLRFYILGNKCVSKTDKKMESQMLSC